MNHPIVEKIDKLVVAHEKPAIFLSGGIDSSIIIHHLAPKCDDLIAYTVKFGFVKDEHEHAGEVAAHYGVKHKIVEIDNMFDAIPEIAANLDRPRFNVWPYFLFKAAKEDGRKTVYVGEGGDEHFGGYPPIESPLRNHEPKLYQQWWVSLMMWILPMYQILADRFEMNIYAPLFELDWEDTIKLHCPPNKFNLRHIYRNILPQAVVNRHKQPSANASYEEMWHKMLVKYFPNEVFVSKERTIEKMQILACKEWLKSRYNTGE